LNYLDNLVVSFFDGSVRIDVFGHGDRYVSALEPHAMFGLAASCFLGSPLRPVKAFDLVSGAELVKVFRDSPFTVPTESRELLRRGSAVRQPDARARTKARCDEEKANSHRSIP
jgi:hypothetical protein